MLVDQAYWQSAIAAKATCAVKVGQAFYGDWWRHATGVEGQMREVK